MSDLNNENTVNGRIDNTIEAYARKIFRLQHSHDLKNSQVFRKIISAYKDVNRDVESLVCIQLDYLVKQLERNEWLKDEYGKDLRIEENE